MNPPKTLQVGDTWTWTATVADYPSSTWTLKFALRGQNLSVIDITAGAGTGDDYAVTVEAATTAGFTAGNYVWTAWVEKGSGPTRERYTVGKGTVQVLADLEADVGSADLRTHARRTLDAIQAVIENRASKAQRSMSINGRSISYMGADELTKWEAYYRSRVEKEQKEDSEEGSSTLIRADFRSP